MVVTFKQKLITQFTSSRFVFNVIALSLATLVTLEGAWCQEAMYVIAAIILGYNGNKAVEYWPGNGKKKTGAEPPAPPQGG